MVKLTWHTLKDISLLFRIVEHPYHSDVPLTGITEGQNDFALLELTWQIDLTATPYANSACLPTRKPSIGDIVSKEQNVRKTAITTFNCEHFRA